MNTSTSNTAFDNKRSKIMKTLFVVARINQASSELVVMSYGTTVERAKAMYVADGALKERADEMPIYTEALKTGNVPSMVVAEISEAFFNKLTNGYNDFKLNRAKIIVKK